MRKYEKNGQVWLVENHGYERHNGTACQVLDLYGDIETFIGADKVVQDRADLADGWVRYWMTDTDPELQESATRIVELNERATERGWGL